MFDLILQILLSHGLELLGVALSALIGWAADTARRKWGLEIEARHREALHSALMTGARVAIERGLSGDKAATLAAAYAEASVPQAIAALRPSETVLTQLAKSKLAAAR